GRRSAQRAAAAGARSTAPAPGLAVVKPAGQFTDDDDVDAPGDDLLAQRRAQVQARPKPYRPQVGEDLQAAAQAQQPGLGPALGRLGVPAGTRSEEHTSELQSRE